jgi:hypothetical protein
MRVFLFLLFVSFLVIGEDSRVYAGLIQTLHSSSVHQEFQSTSLSYSLGDCLIKGSLADNEGQDLISDDVEEDDTNTRIEKKDRFPIFQSPIRYYSVHSYCLSAKWNYPSLCRRLSADKYIIYRSLRI